MQGKVFNPSAEDLCCVLGILYEEDQVQGIKDQNTRISTN